MMDIVVYVRYNSNSQTENAIKGQLDKCYEYAHKNNLNVIRAYIDNGLSGINANRPQFQQMIQDSYQKQFQGVLVYQLDRFGINKIESAINENTLNKNGVQLMSVCEDLTNDSSTILLKNIIEKVTEYYTLELDKKIKNEMKT